MPTLRQCYPDLPRVLVSKVYGIEIESEKADLLDEEEDTREYPPYWLAKRDGSLRGDYPFEMATIPLTQGQLRPALEEYQDIVAHANETYSYRTSTHVHINVQHRQMSELIALVPSLIYADTHLFSMGCDERRGNYNCREQHLLKAMLPRLVRLLSVSEPLDAVTRRRTLDDVVSDVDTSPRAMWEPRPRRRNSLQDLRYMSTNWAAMTKFGTIEFRHFHGTSDPATIEQWALACNTLVNRDPRRDPEFVSAEHFLTHIFGARADDLCYIGMDLDFEMSKNVIRNFMYYIDTHARATLNGRLVDYWR
jgi:hypothetical protein